MPNCDICCANVVANVPIGSDADIEANFTYVCFAPIPDASSWIVAAMDARVFYPRRAMERRLAAIVAADIPRSQSPRVDAHSTAEMKMVTPPVAKFAKSATTTFPSGEPIAAPNAASLSNHASNILW